MVPYAKLSPEELTEELDRVASSLSGAVLELCEVKVQYLWIWSQAYKGSLETSVSGRERDAEVAAIAIKEDEIRLQGNIDSLSVLRDLLVVLRG